MINMQKNMCHQFKKVKNMLLVQLHDDDIMIENIAILKLKIMHLSLCLNRPFKNGLNNEMFDLERLI